ncbi:MAG: hypothetical protein ACJAVV_003086 [Alphaproteobacteria bacterium]|jgi:hypothetical protein
MSDRFITSSLRLTNLHILRNVSGYSDIYRCSAAVYLMGYKQKKSPFKKGLFLHLL